MNCPYCGKKAKWCENKEIYGKNYGKSYMCYLCRDCDAYVGCHKNSRKALGRMANRELRELRKTAKNLWIEKRLNGNYNNRKLRGKEYAILNDFFGYEFHFGNSTIDELEFLIAKFLKK